MRKHRIESLLLERRRSARRSASRPNHRAPTPAQHKHIRRCVVKRRLGRSITINHNNDPRRSDGWTSMSSGWTTRWFVGGARTSTTFDGGGITAVSYRSHRATRRIRTFCHSVAIRHASVWCCLFTASSGGEVGGALCRFDLRLVLAFELLLRQKTGHGIKECKVVV
jgi:hypothetical protein